MTEFLVSKSKNKNAPRFVFAHGAGAPMDSEFMNTIAEELSGNGVEVIRFEFPYMAMRRIDGKSRGPGNANKLLDDFRAVITEIGFGRPLFIGGKSMGGRIASMIADEYKELSGLICLGYPFHPPGKPENLRTEHLETLKTKALILQGERDAFGTREEVAAYPLSKRVRIEWLTDGDHSFKPRKKSGSTLEENLRAAIKLISAFILK
ncbi:MAG: alpha/beta fold hydrolase [Pyrinomonadaceae bacterium]